MLFEFIQSYIQDSIQAFHQLPDERKHILEKISQFVVAKLKEGKTPELIYVCTHNSRRSHFGQIWG